MKSTAAHEPAWHVEEARGWRLATPAECATRAWLPEPMPGVALPFQPRSFRDCSLYERHWVQASRGYVRRFMPMAGLFTCAYERLLRRPFPAFQPHPLAVQQPVYYFGNHLSFVPSGTPMRAPRFTQALDYELELGAVLAKPLHNATPEQALDAIGGFVVVNDWSARDVQRREMGTGLGPQKSKHFCNSMSDEVVDAADVWPHIEQLQARVEVNGVTVARTSTAGMLHDWGRTLSHLSMDEPLWPGELIATGTLPHGCAMENGRWLRPGDTLHLVIEGVGEIRHRLEA
ncbi:MAG: fumarylacetoacetate hydrolase family protein [Burkholderiales bacterium]|nr:fumarylacetoacetate hydrolase family protein [Burkholderiales bacterium]MBH2015428.1 fumarylacetoacetate hydrolase family protein [Burkholderiales bacterium]